MLGSTCWVFFCIVGYFFKEGNTQHRSKCGSVRPSVCLLSVTLFVSALLLKQFWSNLHQTSQKGLLAQNGGLVWSSAKSHEALGVMALESLKFWSLHWLPSFQFMGYIQPSVINRILNFACFFFNLYFWSETSYINRPWWEEVLCTRSITLGSIFLSYSPFVTFSYLDNNSCSTYTTEVKLHMWIDLDERKCYAQDL